MSRRVTAGILPTGFGDLSINGSVLTVGGTNNSITITPVGTGITRSSKDFQIEAGLRLRLADNDSTNWVGFKAPATVSTNVTWTLPSADGSDNTFLSTDGAGNLSWISANLGVQDQTSSTSVHYPLFTEVTTNTTSETLYRASTKLSFIPSSGIFSASGVSVTASTASSGTGSGALIVTGGAGIGGQLSANTLNSGNSQITSLGVGTAASGTSGEVRATNNVVAYFSSDAKFKENIRDIPNALDKVCSIGGKLFSWTDEYVESKGGADGYFILKDDYGVIAQDVLSAFPEAVRKRDDDSLAVDYAKLSALAFAAIAELKKEIDVLKGN
jgi:hypothetical protein